jgi:hypothetical protein
MRQHESLNAQHEGDSGSKRKNLGERKYTEIRNRFEEAISFFNEMDFSRGVLLLKELELKFVRVQKNEFDKVNP